jgi:hypothetical protein
MRSSSKYQYHQHIQEDLDLLSTSTIDEDQPPLNIKPISSFKELSPKLSC